MFLLRYCLHIYAPLRGINTDVYIQSSITFGETLFLNTAQMKNCRDLILGKVVYISIIYHIPDS